MSVVKMSGRTSIRVFICPAVQLSNCTNVLFFQTSILQMTIVHLPYESYDLNRCEIYRNPMDIDERFHRGYLGPPSQ